jgi:hypothetical protein
MAQKSLLKSPPAEYLSASQAGSWPGVAEMTSGQGRSRGELKTE